MSTRTRFAIAIALAGVASGGCSHTTPYYRADALPLPAADPADRLVRCRLVLVGDAGDTAVSSPVMAGLTRWAGRLPEKTLLVFLGDNIYPAGLPAKGDPGRSRAEMNLGKQLAAIKESGARGLFLSGNHDWADDSAGGLEAVKRQEAYVNAALSGSGHFLPEGGAPGPVELDFHGLRVLVVGTSWWLHREGAVAEADPQAAKDAFVHRLKERLRAAGDRDVVVLAHHPLASHGTHGGFYDWKDHIFPSTHLAKWLWIPTPGLGSLYPLLRSRVYNRQTLDGTEYKDMRKRLTEALSVNRPLVFAAGHDHGLQVLAGGEAADVLLVSALGFDIGSALGHGSDTLFAHLHPGFMTLDVLTDGRVLLRVIEPGETEVVFAKWLRGPRPPQP